MLIDNSYSYINAYQRTQSASLNITGSYFEATGDVNGSYYANGTDGVDISSQAKELMDRIKSLDIFSIIYPNNDARQSTKSLGEVESDFMGDFNNFASFFGQMSGAMGMTSGSFTMGLDGKGGMTVSGSDSAAASTMQNAFSGNQTMTARFAVMAARAALSDAGYTVDGFKDAYASDPVAAIQNNIDALKERLLGFRVNAGNGSMQYGFEREFNMNIRYSSTTVSYTTTQAEEEAAETEAVAVA